MHEIFLEKPAKVWDDGLPIGNGRLGAMVMGKVTEETIIINEETLWYGKDRNRKNPDTKQYLPKIKELLQSGHVEEAQFLAKMAMTSTPKYMNPYQPAGDMRLCFLGHKGTVSHYERRLDIDCAVASVVYQMDGETYRREHFVSQRYQVLVVRITTDALDGVTLSVNMNRKPFEENTEKLGKNTVCNFGQCGAGGINYFTGIRVNVPEGIMETIGDFVYVKNAKEVLIYLGCQTNYVDKHYREICLKRLDNAEKVGFEKIYKTHIKDFQQLYQRMDVSFGARTVPKKTTAVLLEEIRQQNYGNLAYLAETLFHYGRYLMISSSYDCLMPSNLQGIWNGEFVPSWQSEFTININTEMNYWIAEKCQLPECHFPLFKQVKRMLPKGKETAKQLYGCRGFCAHHNTNIWGNTDPEGIFDASPFWSTGGAWLALHFYEHFVYTQDKVFLKDEALPVMREAIRFYEDYLTEMKDGTLVTGPSVSPENTYRALTGQIGALCMGPTMDHEIIRQLIQEYLEGCKILGLSEEESDAICVGNILDRLPPLALTEDGRIMEWQEDYEEMEPGHRHISHLYSLHPGYSITEKTPELFQGAKKTLERRLAGGGGHTGWSRAWITCFMARLKDKCGVEESIIKMFETCIKDNLLDTHPPFQIDGNFGFGEGVLECLVQSHGEVIEFLPACPEAFQEGDVRGVGLRGGIVADFSWKKGVVYQLTLWGKKDQKVKIRVNQQEYSIDIFSNGKTTVPLN